MRQRGSKLSSHKNSSICFVDCERLNAETLFCVETVFYERNEKEKTFDEKCVFWGKQGSFLGVERREEKGKLRVKDRLRRKQEGF